MVTVAIGAVQAGVIDTKTLIRQSRKSPNNIFFCLHRKGNQHKGDCNSKLFYRSETGEPYNYNLLIFSLFV